MMKTRVVQSGLVAAVAGAAVWTGGCEHKRATADRSFEQTNQEIRQEAREMRNAPYDNARGGGPENTPSAAVVNLAEARCQREARCNNIGQGRRYENPSACMSSITASRRDDLNLGDCPGGIDQTKLSACLAEVRSEDCGNPLDTATRLAACRSSQLCLH